MFEIHSCSHLLVLDLITGVLVTNTFTNWSIAMATGLEITLAPERTGMNSASFKPQIIVQTLGQEEIQDNAQL